MLQLMIDSNNDEDINQNESQISNRCLSTEEMTAQGIMFYFAGYDTTVVTLCHIVYYLSANKDCQQILYEELKGMNGFSYDEVIQLKYLSAVIDETLRLAPPSLTIPRTAVKDIEISGNHHDHSILH